MKTKKTTAEGEPPWLARARADLAAGVREMPGAATHPRIRAMFDAVGHPEVKSDETSWCAAGVGTWLKEAGYPIPPRATNLMAMSYETYGRATEIRVGAIGVSYRTKERAKDWRRHVFLIVGEDEGRVRALGCNQSDTITETWIAKADLTAVRWPVAATVQDLAAAGSKDIAISRALKRTAGGLGVTSGGVAAVTPAPPPPLPQLPPVETLQQAADQAAAGKSLLTHVVEIGQTLGALVATHPWLVPALGVSVALYLTGAHLAAIRLARALRGDALSQEA